MVVGPFVLPYGSPCAVSERHGACTPAPAGWVDLQRGRPRSRDFQARRGQVGVTGRAGRRGLPSGRRPERRGLGSPAVPASGGQIPPPAGARLRRCPPSSQAPWLDGDAAVQSVRRRQPAGLQVPQLLRQVPRVRQGVAALDAPGAHRRGEAVHRLRRRHRAHRRWRYRRGHSRPSLRGCASAPAAGRRPRSTSTTTPCSKAATTACQGRIGKVFSGIRKYETPFSSAGGSSPARTLTWIDGRISVGTSSVASRACRMATNASSLMPS